MTELRRCVARRSLAIRQTWDQYAEPVPSVHDDGAGLANVAPNVTTDPVDVAAGVPHIYDFLVTNTTRRACASITTTFAQCSTQTIACR